MRTERRLWAVALGMVVALLAVPAFAGDTGLVVNGNEMPIYVSEGGNFHVIPLLSKLNAPGANIFIARTTSKPGTKIPIHTHGENVWEGLYILSGGGKFTIGDKTYRAGAGSFVYFPAQVPHSFINDRDEDMVVVQIYCPAGGPSDMRFFKWQTWGEMMEKAASGNVLK
jgi:quercetin dioxygenase-like cupin family protein